MISIAKFENGDLIKELVTAKNYARCIIDDYLNRAKIYWLESHKYDAGSMSKEEIADIQNELNKELGKLISTILEANQ